MEDTITFNKQNLQNVASSFNTINKESVTPLGEIGSNLDKISNPANWSGPIANSAKIDLKNAKEAVEDISANMAEINRLLSEAASNFEGINY